MNLSPRPVRDTPGRTCWPHLNGAVPPYTGGPVKLGWPVLMSCPARTHNTLYSSRRPPAERCICPRAKEIRAHFRARTNDARRRTAHEVSTVRHEAALNLGRLMHVDPPTARFLPLSSADPDTQPACRVRSQGGSMLDDLADDFYDESTGPSGNLARFRATSRCRQCPLQRKCLLSAVEAGEPYGIWGGLTPKERRNRTRVQEELSMINDEVMA